MKNQKSGISVLVVLIILSIIVIVGGVYTFQKRQAKLHPENQNPTETPENTNPSVNNAGEGNPVPVTPGVSQTPKDIQKAHNALGIDLIKSIYKEDNSKNIFISPSSVALALSMVYNGAAADTKTAMEKTLRLQGLSLEALNQQSLGLLNSLKKPDPKVEILIANSLWAKFGVAFMPNFIGTLRSYYLAESTALDFKNPESVKTINAWVSKNTKGKIASIISSISNDAVMYLINAVYFKGSWTTEFDKKLTQNRTFTNLKGTTTSVSSMERTDKFPYQKKADFESVELTYGDNERVSMYVFLPTDINTFVSGLTLEKLNGYLNGYVEKKGTVQLPKFKIEYEKQLNSILTTLGMGVAFSNTADFSGIGERLRISQVLHKAYVDVNEEGTEAAAVTGVEVSVTSAGPAPDVFYMEVDHPFLFVIRDNVTSEILFIGTIQNF